MLMVISMVKVMMRLVMMLVVMKKKTLVMAHE